jgi:hypothetical protein
MLCLGEVLPMNYRVMMCNPLLISLACRSWNPPALSSESEASAIEQLRTLLESHEMSLFVPAIQAYHMQLAAQVCNFSADSYYMVEELLKLASSNLGVDEELVLAQANHLARYQRTDLDLAALLIYANILKVDAIVVAEPAQLTSIVWPKDLNEIGVISPIVELEVPILKPSQFLERIQQSTQSALQYIYPRTPHLTIKQLPINATPIDFAYAIHSQIGDQCVSAIVNGIHVELNSKLKNGDVVDIVHDVDSSPNLQWLDFVVTEVARKGIRRGIRMHSMKEKSAQTKKGWEIMEQGLGNIGLYEPSLWKYALAQNCNLNDLANRIGSGLIVIQHVIDFCHQDMDTIPSDVQECIAESGWDLAACCNPLPSDQIVGVVRSGNRPLKVHQSDCPQIHCMAQTCSLRDLEWNFNACLLSFSVIFQDQADILRLILNMLFKKSANPNLKEFRRLKDGRYIAMIEIHISSRINWQTLAEEIRTFPKVLQVEAKKVKPTIFVDG